MVAFVKDAVVVGGGVVGATVCAALNLRGVKAVCYDDGRPGAGTPPSGGHLKPSWFGGLPKEEYLPAMALLDEVWGLKTERFLVLPSGRHEEISRVDIDLVTAYPKVTRTVVGLEGVEGPGLPRIRLLDGEERCRLLVLCTGVWVGELVSGLKVNNKQGVSFRVRGVSLKDPLIKPWAPYKQVVAHQQSAQEVWVGDGTAVCLENWTDERTGWCLNRCLNAIGVAGSAVSTPRLGLRPYAEHPKAEPCLFRRLGPRVWLVTGAGKMGTIAAGWAALRVIRDLPS